MAINTEPTFPRVTNNLGADFDNADGTTKKALVVGHADGTKVFGLACTSDDITSNIMEVYWEDNTTAWLIASVTVPAGAGTDGTTPAVDLLNGVDAPWLDEKGHIHITNPEEIQVAAAAAITASYTVTVVGLAKDFTAA